MDAKERRVGIAADIVHPPRPLAEFQTKRDSTSVQPVHVPSHHVILRDCCRSIVSALRNGLAVESEYFYDTTVSFSSLYGFVTWITTARPAEVVTLLNTVYSYFDNRLAQFGVQKIETVGDSYMVSAKIAPSLNLQIRNNHFE